MVTFILRLLIIFNSFQLYFKIIDEFGRNMIALTVENLLQQFINQKTTGKGRPCMCVMVLISSVIFLSYFIS